MEDNNLEVVQANKEGGFVVLLQASFGSKATTATEKHFRPVNLGPKQQKSKALKLTKDLNQGPEARGKH